MTIVSPMTNGLEVISETMVSVTFTTLPRAARSARWRPPRLSSSASVYRAAASDRL